MSDLVHVIRQRVSQRCCVSRCKKEGCTVRLPRNGQRFVVIDMDLPESPVPERGRRCDFLFVGGAGGVEDWVVPLELKKGKPLATGIVPQLQAGAVVAEALVSGIESIKFRPVAVYGGNLRGHEVGSFRKQRVRFRGMREPIRLIRCGAEFTQALRTP